MTDSPFDQIIDRTQLPTMKWHLSRLEAQFGNPDLIPFWIADQDFPAPDVVINALKARAEHGIYGYEFRTDTL